MLKRFSGDLKKYWPYASYAAKAELKVEISGSRLSWIWWILEPLCYMLIYVFVFGYMFQSKTNHFSIFVFLGLTVWKYMSMNISTSVMIVYNNKHILSKIYMPKFILILKKMMVNAFKMLISFLIVFIMMVFYGVPISLKIIWLLPLFLLLFTFTYGIAALSLHVGIYIQDLEKVTTIVLRMFFFLSGVFYSIEDRFGAVSPKMAYLFEHANPFGFIISSFRDAIIYSRDISWEWYLLWLAISALISLIGTALIYAYEDDYIKVI